MKRKKMLIATTAIFSLLMATTAFAGTWQTGKDANQDKWWYDNGDGTYVQNGWQWIDGNGDGIAESYYFDANGWLLTNVTTPDGYTVNESGAWVENGAVQTKVISKLTTDNSSDIAGNYSYIGEAWTGSDGLVNNLNGDFPEFVWLTSVDVTTIDDNTIKVAAKGKEVSLEITLKKNSETYVFDSGRSYCEDVADVPEAIRTFIYQITFDGDKLTTKGMDFDGNIDDNYTVFQKNNF